MARFTASFPSLLARSRPRPEGARRATPRAHAPVPNEMRKGPGWFDSSWDLQRGLEVREGLPGDAQLHEWIEVCLRA